MRTQLIFLTVLAAFLSISTSAQTVEFDSNSANITNRYFPAKLGGWSYMLGVGTSVGSVIYFNTLGIEEVSGVQISNQTFNNVKCQKINSIWTNNNDEDDFITLWMAQDTQGNLWVLKVYDFFDGQTIVLGGPELKSMFMPVAPGVGDPAGIIMPESATNYCQVVEVDISINTNFGSYNSCIKSHCVFDLDIENVEHYCPDFGLVKLIEMDDGIPQDIFDLKEYDTVTTTRAEIIGTWSDGIWYWDAAASDWTRMTSSTPTGDIAAGDFTGDGKADVASIWGNGLWYQDGATSDWTKIAGTAPDSLAAGDVTGDGLSEIIGTWSSGLWYWDGATFDWTKVSDSVPTQVTAGDITGD
jgi:hypothetical protein